MSETKDYGRYKWGESDQLGDQAIDLMANMDEWMNQYKESDSVKGAMSYMDEDDRELLANGFELMKHAEKFVMDWANCIDRMDHKLTKIEKMVKDLYDR